MTAAAADEAPDPRTEAVHELSNLLFVIQTSVGYLVAHTALDQECRDVVADLQLCVERFPGLLGRLRAGLR